MQLLYLPSALVPVLDSTHVAEVSRYAADLAQQLGFGETARARAAAAVHGAGSNLLKHAGGGELFVGIAGTAQVRGIQILALDRGRGMVPARPGRGLASIQQSSTTFDVYTAGDGTVLAATVYPDGVPALPVGGVSVAAIGEMESGDAWAAWTAGALTSVFVCDGGGRGAEATAAARVGVESFRSQAERSAQHVIEGVHDALRGTRGAAVALAELDYRSGTLRYCALGNICGAVLTPDGARQPLATVPGIAGHVMRRLQVVTAPWTAGSLLVLHSDGLSTHWSLPRYPGLSARRADVIAGVLLRDHKLVREDTTVVIARNPADS
jgi:anti-sigma regulatory factor (Ser/Thr protein kinase)